MLETKNIEPGLAVILVGNRNVYETYFRMKQKMSITRYQ